MCSNATQSPTNGWMIVCANHTIITLPSASGKDIHGGTRLPRGDVLKQMFEVSAVIGIMLGMAGIISALSGFEAVGAMLWIIGFVIVLVGYYVGVVDVPVTEGRFVGMQQYPPVPAGMTAFCPHCGSPVAPVAAMCPRCGRSLKYA